MNNSGAWRGSGSSSAGTRCQVPTTNTATTYLVNPIALREIRVRDSWSIRVALEKTPCK